MAILTITLLVLALLGVAVAPIDRVRRVALSALSFLLHGSTLAALLACGSFAMKPDLVPNVLRSYFSDWNAEIRALVPHLAPGGEWIVLAVVLAIVSVPLLELVSFAKQISGYRSAFSGWVRGLALIGNDLHDVAADPNATPQQKNSVRDAADALVAMSQPPALSSPSPRRGVRCSLYELLKSRK